MIRWGILGTGGVSNAFADALLGVPDAQFAAVGSRDPAKATAFTVARGRQPGERPAGWSYEGLVNDPTLDVIYVGTPASHHYRHALLALRAGKHVLVEKPFTTNATQAEALVAEAQVSGRFLMEAMWCRFLPSYVKLRQVLAEGSIGPVHAVGASFGGRADIAPRQRPFRRDLAGGALLDGAVYPVSFAEMILGEPCEVHAVGLVDPTLGVDLQTAVTMRFPGGEIGQAFGAIGTTLSAEARIYGHDGMIVLPGNFTNPAGFDVLYPGGEPTHYDTLPGPHRLAYQADEVGRMIAEGQTESEVMPWADTLAVMRTLDRARAEIGLRFTDEAEAL